jgi:metallophosphoesterase superfamily enzyme
MTFKQIKEFLLENRGYIKKSPYVIAERLDLEDVDLVYNVLREVRSETKHTKKLFKKDITKQTNRDVFKGAFEKAHNKISTPVTRVERSKSGKNVLVIGDLHLPFTLEGYLEHCMETYNKYKCNEVVFIGDIIDNHASSYHETDPDGHSAGQELDMAISQIRRWYAAFPKATVTIGNHDRLIMRKAQTSGLSKRWIRDYSEVLGVPGWNFVESIEIDDVMYTHGEAGTAKSKAIADLQSTVQGHLHTQCYVEWIVGAKFKIFGMQVGCGIDHRSYAMAYAKAGKKPAISCGVVLQGETAVNIMMNL